MRHAANHTIMQFMCCQRAPLEAQLHFQAAPSGLARVKSHWRMTSTLQQGHEQPSSDSLLGVSVQSAKSAKWCRGQFWELGTWRRLQKLQLGRRPSNSQKSKRRQVTLLQQGHLFPRRPSLDQVST